ncbi:hypothetical protein KUCAC02_015804, partial [Chaenocephalus aceratus]
DFRQEGGGVGALFFSSSSTVLFDVIMKEEEVENIDTSMYDLGPSGAPPSKMAPMVTADDLVRSMSGFGATSGQNQPFKMDLAELDHIMEVLVGS